MPSTTPTPTWPNLRWRLKSALGLSTPGRLFVFARHAESEANIANVLSSNPARPVALTEHGRHQARELGAQLTNPVLISPSQPGFFARKRRSRSLSAANRCRS